MKWLKWVAWTALGLVLLVLGLMVALWAWFDGEKIRQQAQDYVQARYQRQLSFEQAPSLALWPQLGVQLQGVRLTEPQSKDLFVELQQARVAVAVMPLLSRSVVIDRLELHGLKANITKRKDGSFNFSDLAAGKAQDANAAPQAEAAAPSAAWKVGAVEVKDLAVLYRDESQNQSTDLQNLSLSTGPLSGDTGAQTFQLKDIQLAAQLRSGADGVQARLDLPLLERTGDRWTVPELSVQALAQQAKGQAQLRLTVADVAVNGNAVTVREARVEGGQDQGERKLSLQLQSAVQVQLVEQTVQLPQLQGQADLVDPALPNKGLKLPIQGKLSANWGKPSAALDLKTQVDQSPVSLSLQVPQVSPLALVFDLQADALNVDHWVPPGPSAPAEPKSGGSAADTPIDLSALKGPKVNGHVRIGQLQARGFKAQNLDLKLALNTGRLEVAPMSVGLYGGTATGRLVADANGNKFRVEQDLRGISILPLLQDVAQKDLLDGKGNVGLAVDAQGASVKALIASLNGNAQLALKDGSIKGINLAQSLRDIKSKLGAADSTEAAKEGAKTDFSELTASFQIQKGIARNEDLSLKSPFVRVGGNGEVNLPASSVNYLVKAAVVATTEGQGGKDLGQIKGLTVPVRVEGPFNALNYRFEWSKLFEDAAKAKLDEKKQEIKKQVDQKVNETKQQAEQAVKEKAGDLLKGLFK